MLGTIILSGLVVAVFTAGLGLLISLIDGVVNNYGDIDIHINGSSKKITVKGGVPLLSALSNEKIFIPSACGGKGSCGACKLQINTDLGEPLPTEIPWLNEDELKQHVRLSCQVKVKQELDISIPEELFLVKRMKCRVIEIEDMTYDIKRVRIKIIDGQKIDYQAGQYAQIVVPPFQFKRIAKKISKEKELEIKKQTIEHNIRFKNNEKEDFPAYLAKGEVSNLDEVQRAYSMSSFPKNKDEIELIIRYVPGGIATSFVYFLLENNQNIEVVGPFGDFYLRDTPHQMLWVAGGSGLAPFKSILYDMLDKGIHRDTWFFFGARTQADLYYVKELTEIMKEYKFFHFIPALSVEPEDSDWKGERGIITDVVNRYIQNIIPQVEIREGYLCGSPGLIDSCMKVFDQHQIKDVYYDSFT